MFKSIKEQLLFLYVETFNLNDIENEIQVYLSKKYLNSGFKMDYILTIDQGTSSTRAILFDASGSEIDSYQKEHKQFYPKTGMVEHNPEEIWKNTQECCFEITRKLGWDSIKSIGITNQRETIIAWDESSGKILENAIVWQCRRSTEIVERLVTDGYKDLFHKKTGLILDAYFSGTKVKWLLDNSERVKTALKNETLRFGTIDSFLAYKMSGKHITDISNASRTLLFNLNTLKWDSELLEILKIPEWTLPEVLPSSFHGEDITWRKGTKNIPINGIAGDQQSALFGQSAFSPGDTKVTYGTGNFALTNTGSDPRFSNNGLLTTIAWSINELKNVNYALEGSVFISGALIQWLRDELKIIDSESEIEELAKSSGDIGSLVIVPGFVGLGAPYWDQKARGSIFGLTRGTDRSHLAKASLESIALQTHDLISLLQEESNARINELRVDGGACKNNYLMQIQSDLLQKKILRPKYIETTSMGAAMLAGLGCDLWNDLDHIKELNPIDREFNFDSNYNHIIKLRNWKKAIARSLDWEN